MQILCSFLYCLFLNYFPSLDKYFLKSAEFQAHCPSQPGRELEILPIIQLGKLSPEKLNKSHKVTPLLSGRLLFALNLSGPQGQL